MNNGSQRSMDTLNLTDVVRGLRDIFASEEVNPDEVKALLRAYRSNPEGLDEIHKIRRVAVCCFLQMSQ